MTAIELGRRERRSHIWDRHSDDWYVEPRWCSERLFDSEIFIGEVIDPCCGSGNIVKSARARHLPAEGWDTVNRGFPGTVMRDWLQPCDVRPCNVVCNPPFAIARPFAELAVERARHKSAILFPVARLNAAGWLRALPLARVWLLTPRPSMPPGEALLRGEKPAGGKTDFCWLVFDRNVAGHGPTMRWLHRDGGADGSST